MKNVKDNPSKIDNIWRQWIKPNMKAIRQKYRLDISFLICQGFNRLIRSNQNIDIQSHHTLKSKINDLLVDFKFKQNQKYLYLNIGEMR